MGGVAVVFPGQGGQTVAMGVPWRDAPGWWIVDRASDVLDEDLAALLLTADAERLARTRDAQLAVLLTSLVAWESDPLRHDDSVVAMAGHSLGQVTALVASGVLSIDNGVRFAAQRADATQAAADAHPGRMAALLGGTIDQATSACAAAPSAAWVANDNAPGQVVIAGTPAGVDTATNRAQELGVRKSVSLNVGGAFHTPLMDPARDGLVAALDGIELSTGRVPVVGNADAAPHRDAEGWRSRLVDHIVSPVRWRDSQLALVALGATELVEMGGPGTLAAMAKRTVPDIECRVVNAPTVGASAA
ncbi:MAG TPA: ACP S-malonyltransferase [Acidimicrobiales bacterium]|nr:ACP S-malonyltransferase [Acidimicrobiales bacterium]